MLSILIIIFILIISKTPDSSSQKANINEQVLENLQSYMGEVAPCQHFYEYACGKWAEKQADNLVHYVDTIGGLEFNANNKLAELLEERILKQPEETNAVYQKLRIYYESCRKLENTDADLKVTLYLDFLKPTEQLDWPNLYSAENRQTEGFHWLQVLGHLRAYSFNGVLLTEELKYYNATRYIIQLGMPDSVEFTKWERAQLMTLSTSIYLRQRALAEQLEKFGYKLKALYGQLVNQTDSVQELSLIQLENSLNISAYFAELFVDALPTGMHILVSNLAYLRKLNELLLDTRPEIVLFYLKLKLLSYLRARQPKSAAPHHCIQHLRTHMSLALDFFYEMEHFRYERHDSVPIIEQVFHILRAKFEQHLERHNFSVQQMIFLRNKLQAMQLNVGNLPAGVGEHFYSDYYRTLHFVCCHFQWNHLNLLKHFVHREHILLRLTKSTAPEHSFHPWPYGSPAYNPHTNCILIPFAYLQMPIFHKDFHELYLFAELGNTLGHELMHGFDTYGLQYDAAGNPSILFTGYNATSLQQSISCLNSEATTNINEKLADFSGFQLAFEAYFDRAGKSPLQLVITSVGNLTVEQIFFIKFAQFFCAVKPTHIEYDNTHDTPFLRVPQVVNNHLEFARIFQCDNQLIKKSCTVW